MKKILFFVVAMFAAFSAIASDQFYVITRDGSVESAPTDEFDNPQTSKIMGFNHMYREIADLQKEVEALKTGNPPLYRASGSVDGHEYVDLGLPSGLKWATMNIGAKEGKDYGTYFAWGEIAPAPDNKYSEANCKAYGKSFSSLKSSGVIDANGNLTADYDAATQNWGKNWRMPTEKEFEELINYCTWTRTTILGMEGYKVVNKSDKSKWIFLPDAGRVESDGYKYPNNGYYWSSTKYGDSYPNFLFIDSSSQKSQDDFPRRGYSVRPVTK